MVVIVEANQTKIINSIGSNKNLVCNNLKDGDTMSETLKKLREYILDNFLFTEDENALGNDDSFMEKGIIDSTGILEVVTFIEEDFGFKVNDEDLIPENLDSVNNLAAFIQRKNNVCGCNPDKPNSNAYIDMQKNIGAKT